jgi:hypothetical protein
MFTFDPNQKRPTFEESRRIWDASVFSLQIDGQGEPEEFLREIRKIYSNGGAEFARFTIAVDPRLDWFVSRNRLDEIHFLEHFLKSGALSEALPVLQSTEQEEPMNWEWSSSYVLDGEFAYTLKMGGAYEAFAGSGVEAKQLGAKACEILFGSRYDDLFVFKTYKSWSLWFHDIAWDATWIGVDKGTRTVWILCITDTH